MQPPPLFRLSPLIPKISRLRFTNGVFYSYPSDLSLRELTGVVPVPFLSIPTPHQSVPPTGVSWYAGPEKSSGVGSWHTCPRGIRARTRSRARRLRLTDVPGILQRCGSRSLPVANSLSRSLSLTTILLRCCTSLYHSYVLTSHTRTHAQTGGPTRTRLEDGPRGSRAASISPMIDNDETLHFCKLQLVLKICRTALISLIYIVYVSL